jgi:transposase
MTGKRKQYSAGFKEKVAVARRGVYQTVNNAWKKSAIAGLASVFFGKTKAVKTGHAGEVEKLYAMIVQLMVGRGFCAKPLINEG